MTYMPKRFCIALFITGLLAGCAMGPITPSDAEYQQSMARAEALAAAADNAGAAEIYEKLANRTLGETRDHLRILAAEQWRQAAFPEYARELLEQVEPRRLPFALQVEYALVQAELDLLDANPRQALDWLGFIDDRPGTEQQIAVLGVRARALFDMGSAIDATRLLLRREKILADPAAIQANQRLIWNGLSKSREVLDAAAMPRDTDPTLLAWIRLGDLGRNAWQNPDAFERLVHEWQAQYPRHPANQYLIPDLIADYRRLFSYPAKVALILPLSGRYATQAVAVRDGFLAARYQMEGARNPPPEILIYDSGESPTAALERYREARAAGAGFIVGPLTKEALSEFANQDELAVPVLGLNYLDNQQARTPPRLYQFGLSPEDEAVQVAERLIQEGLTRGVALVPAGDWGNRMMLAFKQRFEELNGTLLNGQYYAADENDFSTPIMRVLNLDESALRHQSLRGTLNLPLQFEPRRRQDAQFVFLAARERDAKLIRPQLRFHQALDLPVYATSHVYALDQKPDRDLDGIHFADMPWTIAPDAAGREVREQLRTLWPSRFEQASRLYALGFDAFRLVPVLLNTVNPLSQPVAGMTGLLSMDQANRIHRGLYWAGFRSGVPRLLPPPQSETDTSVATLDAQPAQ